MNHSELNLDHLPLQKELVLSAMRALKSEKDVLAAVLLGSLASGKGDRVSDADIIVFTQNGFHQRIAPEFIWLKPAIEIFYTLDGFHNPNAYFKKYLFADLTSAEIHYVDLAEPFELARPFKVLFDKSDVIPRRLTDKPAPAHKDFAVYPHGDKGLIWELFDCIKWLSRDDTQLAKDYLKKLATRL